MSTAKETLIKKRAKAKGESLPIINRVIDFLSSVRFGVVMLCVLVVLSIVGMVVVQQNVVGFDTYYASLTPAEKTVFGNLGFFDIYHSWYFNLLLLILSLNIILASIDRIGSAWAYVVKPKLTATDDFLERQQVHESFVIHAATEGEAIEKASSVLKTAGYQPEINAAETSSYLIKPDGTKDFSQTVKNKITTVFAQKGKTNRLGAYIVHVALLTLFLGHFVALTTGFDADVVMMPGETTSSIQLIEYDLDKKEKFNVEIPFSITCTDIEQKLIDPRGNIGTHNTLDWRTQIRIDDPAYGETVADVSLNNPFNYRGYRFFQAQTLPTGNARSITLDLTSQASGEQTSVNIPRNGSTTLQDGTKIEYDEFLPDFAFNAQGNPDTRSNEYNNPVAVLSVTPPLGERTRVFAFPGDKASNIPVGAPKAGYKWSLGEFEKAPLAHVLSIKYDPYSGAFIAWYFGGIGLIFALAFVFFFAHRRIWINLERRDEHSFTAIMAGDANRNHVAFKEKFNKLLESFGVTPKPEE